MKPLTGTFYAIASLKGKHIKQFDDMLMIYKDRKEAKSMLEGLSNKDLCLKKVIIQEVI